MTESVVSPIKPAATPEKPPQLERKRPRRSAAMLATSRIASSDVVESYIKESVAEPIEIHEEDHISEEETEGGRPVSIETRQRRTILRLEADVNDLKRARKEDQITITNLRKTLSGAVYDKVPREGLEKELEELKGVAGSLIEALIKERFNNMNMRHRLDVTEERLKAIHAKIYPSCCICQEAGGQVDLHGKDHRVCLSCFKGVVTTLLNGSSKGMYLECPLCKEKIYTIKPLEIAYLAGADMDSWKVAEDAVLCPPYSSIEDSLRDAAFNAMAKRLGVSVQVPDTIDTVNDALGVVIGDYEQSLVGGENDEAVVDMDN